MRLWSLGGPNGAMSLRLVIVTKEGAPLPEKLKIIHKSPVEQTFRILRVYKRKCVTPFSIQSVSGGHCELVILDVSIVS